MRPRADAVVPSDVFSSLAANTGHYRNTVCYATRHLADVGANQQNVPPGQENHK